jgi:phosphinothricin acetyltransferase
MTTPLSTQDILIRPATLADCPAIHAIYSYNVAQSTATWELTPPDQAEMEQRMQAVLAHPFPYFVAERENRLIGYAYASSYRPRPGYRFTVEDSIYVDQTAQGRGVGRLLLSRLIDACAAQGFRQMVAVIGDSENRASIELHRRLGFTQTGLLPNLGFKFGRWLDIVILQRALGEGATTLP